VAADYFFPHFIEPMLFRPVHHLCDSQDLAYEVKLNGLRVILTKIHDKVTVYSRQGLNITHDFRDIAMAARTIPADLLTLDGEIVILNPDGRPALDQKSEQRLGTHRCFYAFDCLNNDGRDLCPQPYRDRKQLLHELFFQVRDKNVMRLSPSLSGCLNDIERHCRLLGFEGMLIKKRNAPYLPGKRSAWMKYSFDQHHPLVRFTKS